MAVVCPTVTAEDLHTYRQQVERLQPFATRVHLDFMDGLFTQNRSVDLDQIWRPESVQIDLHLMYMRPDFYIDTIKQLNPSLVIVHAEAKGDFSSFANIMHDLSIKVGVALLQQTSVSIIAERIDAIDHVLVFSGNLGHFGGEADLSLLDKVAELRRLKPELEIGWDGGISDENCKQLVEGGVDVLNVGGFIQKTENPEEAYSQLVSLLS